MVSVPPRTSVTICTRLSFMWRSARSRAPVSSRELASMRRVRSPLATVSASCTASRIGRTMPRVSCHEARAPSSTENRASVPIRVSLASAWSPMVRAAAAIWVACMATSCCIDSW